MGNKSDKNKQSLLQQQQAQDRAAQQQFMAQANTKSPLELAQEQETLDWMKDTSAPGFDVTKLKGMSPYLDLYNRASNKQEGERMGTGLFQMGHAGDQSGLATLLGQQSADHRQQEAAGQLSNAFTAMDATKRGNVMPLLGLQQNRNMGLASLAGGQSSNSTNMYTQFKPGPSFLQQLLLAGVAAGGQAAGAYLGKP